MEVFSTAGDREVYLDLVRDNLKFAGTQILAYCLMPNHVHWIVIPEHEDSLAMLFQRVHGRYAQYWNARTRRSGHLWQNRYFSCALGRDHLAAALRYVEWNPIRAGMVQEAVDYAWSSAARHVEGPHGDARGLLDWSVWREMGGGGAWRLLLDMPEDQRVSQRLRSCTYAGRPLGSADFLLEMEERFSRHWTAVGRPPKKVPEQSDTISTG